jgi:hypothetical protein
MDEIVCPSTLLLFVVCCCLFFGEARRTKGRGGGEESDERRESASTSTLPERSGESKEPTGARPLTSTAALVTFWTIARIDSPIEKVVGGVGAQTCHWRERHQKRMPAPFVLSVPECSLCMCK